MLDANDTQLQKLPVVALGLGWSGRLAPTTSGRMNASRQALADMRSLSEIRTGISL